MKKSVVAFSTLAILSSTFVSPALAGTYTVKSGDNLSKIAQKHNTTVKDLKQLNNLRSDFLRINQKLITPNSKTTSNASSVSVKKTKKTTYTIVSGDTLTRIANKHNLTLAELMKMNNLKSDRIYAGAKLIVSKSTTTTTIDLPSSSKPSNVPTANSSTYIVVKGDTLSKISNKTNLTVAQLKSINSLKSDLIRVGQKLKLSKSASTAPADKNDDGKVEAPSSGNKVAKLVSEAKKLIGTPYSWAGASPSGFDCSGFIYYTFKKAGYEVPRLSSSTYYDMGKKVTSPKSGDLIFFATGSHKAVISHMGIYLGGGEFIHASSSKGVTISTTSNSYFKSKIIGYRSL
ncbi:LysM peptidoglycan-binding domain-containing protein [Peribacillus simplex]|uniref:LysM peptidoglycan-binding domain-containing protein n=2 Tax=Peribacillus TaxID=2675229 RepID=A0AA90T074_9BACI|nr:MULTISPECIES: peptidoglycan endopeptidase [Peribacillus]MDP1416848.1 LysM peptidoglycan-binding domain-containing protein [Peribacillus simplex]MDP1449503.1 LysM peptidoglycan-binding domain-containing protein [Peribacillus frigoritolerans]